MDKTNETSPRFEPQDDIIELGTASVETQGPLPINREPMGGTPLGGISPE